jgi:broad specificity phosphatase PhoE
MPLLPLLLLCSIPTLGCSSPRLDRSRPKSSSSNLNAGGGQRTGVKGLWPKRFPFKVLYVVRHSSTVFNRFSQIGGQIEYDPLDSLGFKERVGIFLLLRSEPIKAIYTSMQRRSQMTAAPLAAHLKLKIRKTAALNEFSGGISEGICYSLMGKRPSTEEGVACDQSSDDPLVKRAEEFLRQENKRRFKVGIGYRWPGGGESILDVDKRLDKWLRTLPPDLKDQTVVLFGHSGANRFLLAKLMGWKLLDAVRVRQGHTQVWRIERKGPGKLELKMYLSGKWVDCAEPPTMRKGLPCLRNYK